jgi:hypothetical protein
VTSAYLPCPPAPLPSACCILFVGKRVLKKGCLVTLCFGLWFLSDVLHERYDLKGSWVNRHRGRLEKGQYTTCRYCTQKFIYMEVCAAGRPCAPAVLSPLLPSTAGSPSTLVLQFVCVFVCSLQGDVCCYWCVCVCSSLFC